MIGFARRNLLNFFRDKTAVFFSLLAVFIIIGLYALFLGDIWVGSLPDMIGVRYLMDSWIMAGLIAVTSITTTMGAFGIMVEDRAKKIVKDITSSPLSRAGIAGGYIISAYLIGVIMSLVTVALAEVYVIANGGRLLSAAAFGEVFALILLSCTASTALVLFIVSFFKSANAFATASTILGTMMGFLTGIYIPIGQLPEAVQWVVKIFPVSHAAVLLRQVMMQDALSATFAGAPESAVSQFKQAMGMVFTGASGGALPGYVSMLVLAATALVFFGLSVINLSRKRG